MLDFLKIATKTPRQGVVVIYPKFVIKKSEDLMIRGGDFYAVWDERKGVWSTDEQTVIDLIDAELTNYKEHFNAGFEGSVQVFYMWDAESGMIDRWHKYCSKQLRDYYHPLDENLIFADHTIVKSDYATTKLPYSMVEGSIESYERIISTLYSEENRHKIEWAIGCIVAGDSVWVQKFVVFYGEAGTGKSTIINIIQMLFPGYYHVFDAKALGSASNAFSLEPFKDNPLIGIQHDGDLSRIEDNTRLNSLVAHETMTVNEKFKNTYSMTFRSFLFMGTNRPVKITDAKSGIIRRLIDVSPTGDKIPQEEYYTLMEKVKFELGAIAKHCLEVYKASPRYYDSYIPIRMLNASNDFYGFMLDNYSTFKNAEKISFESAWEMYKVYSEASNMSFAYGRRQFKEELRTYFKGHDDDYVWELRTNKFKKDVVNAEDFKSDNEEEDESIAAFLDFKVQPSVLDTEFADCPAQYASSEGTPIKRWDNVTTSLKNLDTSKLHYVKMDDAHKNYIVIDFDIKGENGEKSFIENAKAASKWPKTYAELSKSGQGIHLHYIFDGDPTILNRIYDENVEIKVFTGNSSLRRKLSKCNGYPIAHVSSGLPIKEVRSVLDWDGVKNEQMLRRMIQKNLNKEYHGATKPSVDYIYDLLEDAYTKGLHYDVSDMYNAVLAFASNSTNQAQYCLKKVMEMHFHSDEPEENKDTEEGELIFFDIEVFPNLFLVAWKYAGEGQKVVRMFNPSPDDIIELCKNKLIGFNNRNYDNHMLYGCIIGYNNQQLYELSQNLISDEKSHSYKFRQAYNLSYTDVYDFCVKKQSLKKWEIELGIHHKELGLPWDQPVPKEKWGLVADYCENDVLATEAVFNARTGDFAAREIQVELVKSLHGINATVNDTTNQLSAKIIFGSERNPKPQFNYRNLAEPVDCSRYEEYKRKFGEDYEFHIWDADGLPTYQVYKGEKLPDGYSILPFFKGYEFKNGKSTYLDEEIGEGGKVYSEPGMYVHVWDGDVASMHPSTMEMEVLFGPKYTKVFSDIKKARVAVKHLDFEAAGKLLNGALVPFLTEDLAPALAQAFKIVINSVYGVTAARFDNIFRDPRNVDNIVAKRGALFMTLLKSEVQKRGYSVAHIKTDSIKIPNATEEIKEFVIKFGKEYGYNFETEADFEKYCLVNDAVYVAKTADGNWTTVGKQFQIPYIRKTLFTHEPIELTDLCETFSVSSPADLYLDMNEGFVDISGLEAEAKKIESKLKKDPENEGLKERLDALKSDISKGHDYVFVGRVGQFCPIKPGFGGGVLYRGIRKNGEMSYSAAANSTGYRWLESETVRNGGSEDMIDRGFYHKLVNDAIDTISKYGDFEWFSESSTSDPWQEPTDPWKPDTTAFDVR